MKKLQSIITAIFKKNSQELAQLPGSGIRGNKGLGHLMSRNPFDQDDPINKLQLKVAYLPDEGRYIAYNYEFSQDPEDCPQWALDALKNEGTKFHRIFTFFHTHNVGNDTVQPYEAVDDHNYWIMLNDRYGIEKNHIYDMQVEHPVLDYD